MKGVLLVVTLAVFAAAPAAAQDISLKTIHKVFIEKMPNDLDQYISAEITKQMNGRLVVVLDKTIADAQLQGTGTERTGTGAVITGRYLGLHDNATGAISLVDKEGQIVLWSAEAGDRSLWFGAMKRGGPRKVADRLVSSLKKAIENAR